MPDALTFTAVILDANRNLVDTVNLPGEKPTRQVYWNGCVWDHVDEDSDGNWRYAFSAKVR